MGGVRGGDTMTQKTATATISGHQIVKLIFVDRIKRIMLNNTTALRVLLHQTMDWNGQRAVTVLLGWGATALLISVMVTSLGMMKTAIMEIQCMASYQMVCIIMIPK